MAKKKKYYGESRMADSFYDGYNKARRLEAQDASMIREDHSAPANLPQERVLKYYPSPAGMDNGWLNDTLSGVDKQIKADADKRNSQFKPHKY